MFPKWLGITTLTLLIGCGQPQRLIDHTTSTKHQLEKNIKTVSKEIINPEGETIVSNEAELMHILCTRVPSLDRKITGKEIHYTQPGHASIKIYLISDPNNPIGLVHPSCITLNTYHIANIYPHILHILSIAWLPLATKEDFARAIFYEQRAWFEHGENEWKQTLTAIQRDEVRDAFLIYKIMLYVLPNISRTVWSVEGTYEDIIMRIDRNFHMHCALSKDRLTNHTDFWLYLNKNPHFLDKFAEEIRKMN